MFEYYPDKNLKKFITPSTNRSIDYFSYDKKHGVFYAVNTPDWLIYLYGDNMNCSKINNPTKIVLTETGTNHYDFSCSYSYNRQNYPETIKFTEPKLYGTATYKIEYINAQK